MKTYISFMHMRLTLEQCRAFPSRKSLDNMQFTLHIRGSSVSTVLHLWIQPTTDGVVLWYLLLKKSAYKWTQAVPTDVVQRSIVQCVLLIIRIYIFVMKTVQILSKWKKKSDRMHVHMYVNVCAWMCVHVYVHVCICMNVCMWVGVCSSVCVRVRAGMQREV